MRFSGKITNSFFSFLSQYGLDTDSFFEITPLEIDFIKDPYSWMDATQVELLLRNIRSVYGLQFTDKDLVTIVGHRAPQLKAWGGLSKALEFFDSPQAIYNKIDKFLSFFISPKMVLSQPQDSQYFFSFQMDFNEKAYPAVKDYLLAVFETLPVFIGKEQTEADWLNGRVKIHHIQEKTLSLLPLKKLDPLKTEGVLVSQLKAREIIDSRGQPALEADVILENGTMGRASVPSGASTGKFEVKELRDGDPDYFFSKGLKKACQNVKNLSSLLKGKDPRDQAGIDAILLKSDSSPLKEKLGGNSLLAVSLACLKAGAQAEGKALYKYRDLNSSSLSSRLNFYLPLPLMNILNGGLHAQNPLSIQEFMIAPFGLSSFREAVRAGCEIFYYLKEGLKAKGFSTGVGDEGGFAPALSSSEQAFDFILSAIERAGFVGKVALALDCASSEFYREGLYLFEGKRREAGEMIAIYEKWAEQYPLMSIEDGLAEEDWEGWRQMTAQLGDKLQLVGDDLFVTQSHRIERGIKEKAGNALLVKYNQVGTLTETKQAILKAKSAGWACVFSHRSGETEENAIADLSLAWETEQIKTGGLSRGERIAKYNRLLRIEEELGNRARFRGKQAFRFGS